MKIKRLNIILSVFLLINILFSQVIVGLMHNHEKDKECQLLHNSSKSLIKKATGNCKVCSFDINHELFFYDQSEFHFLNTFTSFYTEVSLSVTAFDPLLFQSRAPPVCFPSIL